MRFAGPGIALALLSVPGVSSAAVTVFGNSQARECYLAARSEQASQANISNCTQALAFDRLSRGDRVATYVNRGILYVVSGNLEAGLADYDRAIDINPDEPEAYLNKGLALLRHEQSGRNAIPLIDTAIAKGTREPAVAYYARGMAHELEGDIAAAYYDLRRANELAPEWDAPVRDLARFQVQSAS